MNNSIFCKCTHFHLSFSLSSLLYDVFSSIPFLYSNYTYKLCLPQYPSKYYLLDTFLNLIIELPTQAIKYIYYQHFRQCKY